MVASWAYCSILPPGSPQDALAASGHPHLSRASFSRSKGPLRALSFYRSKTNICLKRRRSSRIARVDLKFSPGVSDPVRVAGSFARRPRAGEQAIDVGHGRVERGERRVGAGLNGSAFTLGRRRGAVRARQGADDRVVSVRRSLGEARFDESGDEIAHAVFRNAKGLFDLERAQRPEAGAPAVAKA